MGFRLLVDSTCAFNTLSPADMDRWSVDDVCEHFRGRGLNDTARLRAQRVNGKTLLLLAEADLTELSIPLDTCKAHFDQLLSLRSGEGAAPLVPTSTSASTVQPAAFQRPGPQ